MISRERLHALLRYCPLTGYFFWRESGRGKRIDVPAGSINDKGYRWIKLDGERFLAHRLAWFYVYGEWPEVVDHQDRDTSNTAIANLRSCSRTENARNRKTHDNSALGLKGVHLVPSGRYQADIWRGRTKICLGTYETAEAADVARKRATLLLHGEFANIAA